MTIISVYNNYYLLNKRLRDELTLIVRQTGCH